MGNVIVASMSNVSDIVIKEVLSNDIDVLLSD